MSEAPLANSPEARTEMGDIKDAANNRLAPPTETTQTTDTTDQTKKDTTSTDKTTQSAEGTKEGEKKPTEGVPEKYDLKAPEGYELDAKMMEAAGGIFKELGLNNDQAQKLVDFYTKTTLEAADSPYKKFEEIRTGWRNEVVGDAELGDGSDLKPEVKATIGRAIDAMGPKLAADFREIMHTTGAGDNPTIIRGILALAKQATEGRPVKGGGPSPLGQGNTAKPPTAAKALFPNLP